MANATISQIKVGNTTYDICDAISRDDIETLQNNVSDIETIRSNASTGKSQSDTNKAALANIGTVASNWGTAKTIPYKTWTWGNADLSVPVGLHLLISLTVAPLWTSTAQNSVQNNYKNTLVSELNKLKGGNGSGSDAANAISYFAFSGHGTFATYIGPKTATPAFDKARISASSIPHCVDSTFPHNSLRGLALETVTGSATIFGVAIYQGAFTSGADFTASLRYIRIK